MLFHRLSKKSAGRKGAFARKGIGKTLANKKERFFETHAFAVCVNRPLAYVIYADGGGFLAPAVFRQPHSVSKNKFFDTLD